VNKYREGKVKSTAASRVKENLKPYAYKQSEGYDGLCAPAMGLCAARPDGVPFGE
jgi:hypothetical protein